MNKRVVIGVLTICGAIAGATLLAREGELSAPTRPGAESQQGSAGAGTFTSVVDSDGTIALPEGYRETWAHMGSVALPLDERTGFHDVYTQASTLAAYRETGEFPDGAVLVKEVRGVQAGPLTTGMAHWGGGIDHWFVMVKDREGRFPDNPNWGEGWGWALFEAKAPEVNVSTGFRLSCIGCHTPARSDDWIFVDLYPGLRKRVPASSKESGR